LRCRRLFDHGASDDSGFDEFEESLRSFALSASIRRTCSAIVFFCSSTTVSAFITKSRSSSLLASSEGGATTSPSPTASYDDCIPRTIDVNGYARPRPTRCRIRTALLTGDRPL
jgi:hypothetical protein